ncbi:MAG: hypothetical protein EP330_11290, partial [Deltaproteobacteria bacterium]
MARGWAAIAFMVASAGCVEAPSLGPNATNVALELPPGTTLAAGCEDGEAVVSWTVAAHARITRYEAVVTASTEVERLDLGSEGSGTAALAATTVEACAEGCTIDLVGVGDSGDSDLLLSVTVDVDGDDDGYAGATCGGDDCA